MITKTLQDSLDIMKKVIGEQGSQDPNASDDVLFDYIVDFVSLIMPQDIKVYENYTFFEFDTVADQDEYPMGVAPLPLDTFTNLEPPAFIGIQKMWYYQDPNAFFTKWPLDTQNLGTGKPTDLLFWDNKITLRTVPNDVYTIRIVGYKQKGDVDEHTDNIYEAYWWRYIAYGAAIDWLSDFGQIEEAMKIAPAFERYRSLVTRRTAIQYSTQVPYLAI